MKDDPAVIYNGAAALNKLGQVDAARATFEGFRFPAEVPANPNSNDLIAKAYFLKGSRAAQQSPPRLQRRFRRGEQGARHQASVEAGRRRG